MQIRYGIERGEDVSVCILNYRADGTSFWNQFFVAALRDVNKRVVNYVGVQCPVPKPPPEDKPVVQGQGFGPAGNMEQGQSSGGGMPGAPPAAHTNDDAATASEAVSSIAKL